jgi:hypothetical protein
MDPSRNDPKERPELPRTGFDDARKLNELRRQAQQRMEQDERTAEWPVPPPPRLGSPDAKPGLETVYGAPPIFPQNQGSPVAPAPVYGAPPVPAPVYGAPAVPVRNRNWMIGILLVLLAAIVALIVISRL